MSVTSGAVDEAKLLAALNAVGVAPKSLTHDSNVQAFLSFAKDTEAYGAQNTLLRGSAKVGEDVRSAAAVDGHSGAVVSSTVTVVPSFVLQVLGLGATEPASSVVSALTAALPVGVVKVDRSALVKFPRHKDVLRGMEQLKKIELDGQALKVRKYRPLTTPGDTAYDEERDSRANAVDTFSLRTLLKDYMYSDPATRFQIAKNYFERALNDAKVRCSNVAVFFQ